MPSFPPSLYNYIGTYTLAGLPASAATGATAKVSDIGGGVLVTYNGARWKFVGGQCLAYAMDTRATMTGTTEVVLGQVLLPTPKLLMQYDRIRLTHTIGKSGTSETATFNVRIGTAGTIADTLVTTQAILVTTAISAGYFSDIKIATATAAQKLGSGNVSAAYSGSTSITAVPAAVTISNISNLLYLSVTGKSSSTVETIALEDLMVQYFSTTT